MVFHSSEDSARAAECCSGGDGDDSGVGVDARALGDLCASGEQVDSRGDDVSAVPHVEDAAGGQFARQQLGIVVEDHVARERGCRCRRPPREIHSASGVDIESACCLDLRVGACVEDSADDDACPFRSRKRSVESGGAVETESGTIRDTQHGVWCEVERGVDVERCCVDGHDAVEREATAAPNGDCGASVQHAARNVEACVVDE
ncbi:hypothetical protein [Microbacterium hydrocarbonoxydans]|uniref:hypothetical protein n=1 Tax=Microbacterium hydrocarbonoxydans TaxID=273678 RepID=UPI00203D491E|nr:hypothetical protein [Microbacterium hydrocarbonoxydans]